MELCNQTPHETSIIAHETDVLTPNADLRERDLAFVTLDFHKEGGDFPPRFFTLIEAPLLDSKDQDVHLSPTETSPAVSTITYNLFHQGITPSFRDHKTETKDPTHSPGLNKELFPKQSTWEVPAQCNSQNLTTRLTFSPILAH